MNKIKWECWVVVKNVYTGALVSEGPFTATTTGNENDLDVLTSLYNRILSEPNEGADNHLLDFKVGSSEFRHKCEG